MTSIPYDPGSLAKSKRPANVRATGSAAPEQYSPLPTAPSEIFTHRSHAAQYGRGRRYGITIRALILHTTEGENFLSSINYNTWRPETVSSTAHAGPAGELAIEIDESDRPWTTGRWNDESLTLEIVGRAAWTEAQWRARPLQLEAITRWIVDGCRRHSIPPVLLTAQQFALGASRSGESPLRAGSLRGIVDHRTANDAAISLGHSPSKYSHWDIGPGLRRVVAADIMPEVARRLGQAPPNPTPDPITWTPGGTVLHTTTPKTRLVDTRNGLGGKTGRLDPGEVLEVKIPNPPNVTAQTAIVNVTIVAASAAGHLQVDGARFGEASDGNVEAGETRACPTIAKVDGGVIRLRLARTSAHIVVDLYGVVD